MTTPDTTLEVIPSAAELMAVREMLNERADTLRMRAYTASGSEAVDLTMVACACKSAADSLFDVVNVANAYCGSPAANAALAAAGLSV